MVRLPLFLIALATAGSASAQFPNPASFNNLSPPAIQPGTQDSYVFDRGTVTPRTERLRLKRAIALREEARLMVEAGGGELSARQKRYLQAKAQDILGR